MALFTFRKGGDDAAAKPSATESVEVIRKRAKHRLLGAAVLVLAGVVGFPLVFDGQPRPVAVDIPIEIPDKGKVKPLAAVPESKAMTALVSSGPVMVTEPRGEAGVDKPADAPLGDSRQAVESQAAVGIQANAEAKAETKVPSKPEAKPEPEAGEKKVSDSGRFVVQVGAYADPTKARDARLKVERAGIKTYTQEVQTKDGSRTRVRVGPFVERADAEKAATKIKKLELAAAVLSL